MVAGLRCRDDEAIAVVEAAVIAGVWLQGVLTLGTDNGSQFPSREFRKHLPARGITHRRGGYRDPDPQAFIESWFGRFKKRCARRSEWESIDPARKEIGTYRGLSRTTPFGACLPEPGGGRHELAGPERHTNQSDLNDKGKGVHVSDVPHLSMVTCGTDAGDGID